jgi:hypothetical protein
MPHVHVPGLVLNLDPDELTGKGAQFTCPEEESASTPQYFVCLEADAKQGLWVPLYSGPATGRKGIPGTVKAGSPQWTRSPSFYSPGELWRASHKAVQHGAVAARDRSTVKQPNTLVLSALPKREEFPPEASFKAGANARRALGSARPF